MTHNRRTGEHSYQPNAEELAARERAAHLALDQFTAKHDPARGFPLLQHDDTKPARELEGFGVQAWSQGPIYPCVIAVIERYTDTGEFRSRSFELMLDGHSEEYASHADAEEVAKALLSSPFLRAQWPERQFTGENAS